VVKMKKQSLMVGAKAKYSNPKFGRYLLPAVSLFILLAVPLTARAATLLSQSYVTSSSLPVGAIVSLQKGASDRVEPAKLSNVNYTFGVVIDDGSSELSLSNGAKNQVHVATTGVEQVLVSDINGAIAVGDAITASPIDGVGMKATSNSKIVGVAQDKFPNSSASKQTFKDQGGKQTTAQLGNVPVLVNVSYYYKQPDKSIIPPALQNVANSVAGKKANALPIIISIGVFIIMLIVVVSIIYSLIHSSIISVGRNPMAQAAVYRNVIQLSALILVIVGVSLGVIFMVLTRF
jgi:hypothetical protein